MQTVVKVKELVKNYELGKVTVRALRGVSFEIQKKEFVSIIGPSGCGKSTLMHLIGCLDRPSSGSVFFEGTNVSTISDNDLAEIRNKKIGFVFQTFNLLPRMNAIENVELPLIYSGISPEKRKEKALETLAKVGLADRANHRPPELSGGEQQRVAIARGLVTDPSILLADEPTGNLDSKSGAEVMNIFKKLNSEGVTLVIVTHDPNIAEHSERDIFIKDGQIISDS